MFEVAVNAIIFNNKKQVFLCYRRNYDLWNLPGGGLNKKENPIDGVVRETKEETGLDIKVVKLLGVYNKKRKSELAFSFLCEIIGGILQMTDEADQIDYFLIENLPLKISQKQKERIEDAVYFEENVIFKNQDEPSSVEFIRKK